MEYKEIVRDAITGEMTERFYSEEQIAETKKMELEMEIKLAAMQAEAEVKATQKATAEGKLAALGLTTDDLRALGL